MVAAQSMLESRHKVSSGKNQRSRLCLSAAIAAACDDNFMPDNCKKSESTQSPEPSAHSGEAVRCIEGTPSPAVQDPCPKLGWLIQSARDEPSSAYQASEVLHEGDCLAKSAA